MAEFNLPLMRLTALSGLLLLMFQGSQVLAQTSNNYNYSNNYSNSSSSLYYKPPTTARTPEPDSPWNGYVLFDGDFAQNSANSFSYNEAKLSYQFAPYISLAGILVFDGPMNPVQGGPTMGFEDPQVGFEIKAPLTDKSKKYGQWSALAGTYGLIPASNKSQSNDTSFGWKIYGGLLWEGRGWKIKQVDLATQTQFNSFAPGVISLDNSDSAAPSTVDASASDGTASTTVPATPPPDQKVLITENRLKFERSLDFMVKDLSWELDGSYIRKIYESQNIDQILRLSTLANYDWTKHITTFFGITCDSPFGQPTDGPIFNAPDWVLRVGISAGL